MQPTSIAAFRQITTDNVQAQHYRAIMAAMMLLPQEAGNAWQISQRCNLDKHQCGRRLGEMARLGLVHDTGLQAPTDTGRAGIVYKLAQQAQQEPQQHQQAA